MKLHEMMHEYPVCCHEFNTATYAAQIMKEQNTGVLPVIEMNSRGKLIGIVTDRDLCLRVIAEGRDPNEVKVFHCMTDAPVYASLKDDLEHALLLMQEHQVRRIPIVDADHSICGLVTLNNLLHHLDPIRIVEMLKAVSVPKARSVQLQTKYSARIDAMQVVS